MPGPRERYATPPETLDEMFERSREEGARERAIFALERPIATLDRGGAPPDFVTVTGRGQAMGQYGTVTYRQRAFHILDAIEHAVQQAQSEEDLFQVLELYIPSPFDPLRRRPAFAPAPVRTLFPPSIPENLDPRGERRLAVYRAAVARRQKARPGLAPGRAVPADEPEETTRRGCRLTALRAPLGNDPLAELYCQEVTNSSFSYWIESPAGRAEIDALRGRTWYECKCGYASLLEGLRNNLFWARRRLDGMMEQALRHQRIALQCGFTYRFLVSNQELADYLRGGFFPVNVEVRPFEPCD